MKFFLIFIILLIFPFCLIAQDGALEGDTTNNTRVEDVDVLPINPINPADQNKKNENASSNVNIDANLLYGQNNSILSGFSLIQSSNKFSYQLNNNLAKSNDFGYANSNYYKNNFGFTGKSDLSESFKIISEIDLKNNSYGMFDNLYYEKEKVDSISVALKNEYQLAPSKFNFNIEGNQYVHKLVADETEKNTLYKTAGEFTWLYIRSGANSLNVRSKGTQYYFNNDEIDNDRYFSNEIFSNFKYTEYIKIGLGSLVEWNQDSDWFFSGNIKIGTAGFKYSSFELSYIYDLVPFEPEKFYSKQKFTNQNYELLPAKVHHIDFKSEFVYNSNLKSNIYMKRIKLKANGFVKKNDNFYNYYSDNMDLLSVDTLPVIHFYGKGELLFLFNVKDNDLEFSFLYEYNKYKADNNITYLPEDIFGFSMKYSEKSFEIEFINKIIGKIKTNPDPDVTCSINRALIGTVTVEIKTEKTLYLFGKIENIFDSEYAIREGYMEPGRVFLGGLKIVI